MTIDRRWSAGSISTHKQEAETGSAPVLHHTLKTARNGTRAIGTAISREKSRNKDGVHSRQLLAQDLLQCFLTPLKQLKTERALLEPLYRGRNQGTKEAFTQYCSLLASKLMIYIRNWCTEALQALLYLFLGPDAVAKAPLRSNSGRKGRSKSVASQAPSYRCVV